MPFAFWITPFPVRTTLHHASWSFPRNKSTDNTVTLEKNDFFCETFLDIYVCSVSAAHNVSAKDKWLAFISTTAETANHEAELEAAFKLIGPVEEKFIYAQDVYHPKAGQPAGDNVSFHVKSTRIRPPFRFLWQKVMMLLRILRRLAIISLMSINKLPARISTSLPARWVFSSRFRVNAVF